MGHREDVAEQKAWQAGIPSRTKPATQKAEARRQEANSSAHFTASGRFRHF